MADVNRRKLEEIADDVLDSFPAFLRRIMRDESCSGFKKFDPSRFVLMAVQKHGPVRMSEIGKHMGVSKPYMTTLVNKLISEGLVERVQDEGDRRVVKVAITDTGRATLREFSRNARGRIVKNLSRLEPDEISSLLESTRLIKGIVSRLDETGARNH